MMPPKKGSHLKSKFNLPSEDANSDTSESTVASLETTLQTFFTEAGNHSKARFERFENQLDFIRTTPDKHAKELDQQWRATTTNESSNQSEKKSQRQNSLNRPVLSLVWKTLRWYCRGSGGVIWLGVREADTDIQWNSKFKTTGTEFLGLCISLQQSSSFLSSHLYWKILDFRGTENKWSYSASLAGTSASKVHPAPTCQLRKKDYN